MFLLENSKQSFEHEEDEITSGLAARAAAPGPPPGNTTTSQLFPKASDSAMSGFMLTWFQCNLTTSCDQLEIKPDESRQQEQDLQALQAPPQLRLSCTMLFRKLTSKKLHLCLSTSTAITVSISSAPSASSTKALAGMLHSEILLFHYLRRLVTGWQAENQLLKFHKVFSLRGGWVLTCPASGVS